MADSPLRLHAYLERIGYDGPLTPSVETLRRLHRAQVMSIPFENINLFLGRPIKVDPASIVTKLVDEQRGGYCYELNGLFFLVLQHLGFTVTPLAARVFNGEAFMPPSHRLTMIDIEGERWIADVGFGGNGLIEAVPLELEREFPQYLDSYHYISDLQLGYVFQHKLAGHWRNLYAFTLEERHPADYERMNHFTSTSPESHFTQHTICAIATDEARIILYNDELKIRRPDETITTTIEGRDAYLETLQRYFGIVLPRNTRLQSPYSPFST